jgi:hypothetical protein
MATSSRQSALFGTQDWKRIYQSFRETDFQSYDYETLRKSFIDYLTAYYPETFNDYIESSEFVALLDVIAFMGQALAFRGDLNARENFIDTAERRDSVIKLANLVSYNPKRNITAQGLIKVTAISTSENVIDINGVNLSNTTVIWNDPANSNWQEQFNSILNAALINSQRIGRPGNSQSILGVRTDEYSISTLSDILPVVPYTAEIDGVSMSFELVSATSVNSDSLYEIPPAPNGQFNILYRNDKLGFGSPNTGFFFYFKQGTLQNNDFLFQEKIENNLQDINIQGVNNSDTWLYQLDSNGNIVNRWSQVDNVYVNSNLQGQSARKVFSVTSRFNDQVTYIFGDGVFGEVPVGAFRAYVRSGNGLQYTIDPTEMQGLVVTLDYISRQNRTETLTFTISLQTTVNTAQARESIFQIKERAPARFYTQNRMVNGEDYSNFPYTLYSSIIKSKAVNRSSIGVSRNLDLLDPTGKFSSTNVFSNDGAFYIDSTDKFLSFSLLNSNIAVDFLSQSLPIYLSESEAVQYYQKNFPRYSGVYPGSESVDGKVYWKLSSVIDDNVTGYFYVIDNTNAEIPIAISTYSSYNMKYITPGAQIKIVAPAGYCFDIDRRLKLGAPNINIGDESFIWVGVDKVLTDGSNYGRGNLSSGAGPVTLSTYVPSGAILDFNTSTPAAIIPSFDNTFSNELVKEILEKIELKLNFALAFNNSQLISEERWSILYPTPTDSSTYFISFVYNSINNNYSVLIKNVTYYFGSVTNVRFFFNTFDKIFDPVTGKTIRDKVDILRVNSNSTGTASIGYNFPLFITGQQVESDGYPDDYAVKVTTLSVDNISYDPDFFSNIVGTSSTAYIFFKVFTDVTSLNRRQLLPTGSIVSNYNSFNAISQVIYEYSPETVFYASYGDGGSPVIPRFYKSQIIPGTAPVIMELVDVTSEYSVTTGRGDLIFQYTHNSNNTTRIDPATTNIIDVYLVTQGYYTQYQNWLRDTTNTVPKPSVPTIQELEQSYSSINDYKMISDSVVLNSVVFKPLFGQKADTNLQGTIKVIKNSNVTVSDSQIRSSVLAALNDYFTLDKWDFGDTFYFSELTAYLHVQLAGIISSVVVVSNNPNQTFGDLYEIRSAPNEIFVNGATTNDIVVISALTAAALQR